MTALTFASREPRRLRGIPLIPGLEQIVAGAGSFALTVYLGLSGGGYDILVRSELALVIWWFAVLGLLVGVLPRTRLEPVAWAALGLLTAFLVWTWIGASWAPSYEQALDSVALVSSYLGVLAIGVLALRADSGRAVLAGLAAGIAVVCAIALLSKLTPGLFPYNPANKVYDTGRLSYPFDYSDGVGEFAALGLPLLLYVTTNARWVVARGLGQAGLAVALLCLAMTVSRGGIFAAVVGLVAFYALVPDRIPRLVAGGIAAAGIGVLMAALLGRAALRDSLTAAPASQRHSMLLILSVVLVVSALAQISYTLISRRVARPRWLVVSRRGAQRVTAIILLLVVALLVVAFAGGTVSDLWHDFKQANPSTHSNQYFRLLSLAGSHRYQYWQIALRAFDSSPLHGIGPGAFRYYWAQHQTLAEYVINAHSLWIETLAELGVVGALLIVAFFLSTIVAGVRRALRVDATGRLQAATATAGLLGFCAAAAFDWVWQIGVVPMIAMLLVGTVVSSGRSGGVAAAPSPKAGAPSAGGTRIRPRRAAALLLRIVAIVGALAACWGIAVPLASTIAVRDSQAAARRGELQRALSDATTAQRIEPGAASPRVQRALLLERLGDIDAARSALAGALKRDPLNSTTWLTASRLAVEAGDAHAAVRDYRRARSLNPTSTDIPG